MTIFSCAHPFNAGGPSRPLTKIHEALAAVYGADYFALEPRDFPEMAEPGRLGDAIGAAYDDMAAMRICQRVTDRRERDRVFIGSGGASLRQMRLLHASHYEAWGLPSMCATLWFSSHWEHAQKVLSEEYERHGIQRTPIHPYAAWRAKLEQEESDFIIVPSEFCADTYRAAGLGDKVRVVEFGVDCERFKPLGVKPESERLRVLFPATNPARKGLGYVLRAWQGLDPKRFQLTITGGWRAPGAWPPTMPPVLTTDWVSDEQMLSFYQSHDVLLLPSLEEGQALAVLEAMACGLPVIVTPNVGYGTFHGENGIITVSQRDPTAIQTALMALDASPHMVKRFGAAARQFAESRPWSRFQAGVLEVAAEMEGK